MTIRQAKPNQQRSSFGPDNRTVTNVVRSLAAYCCALVAILIFGCSGSGGKHYKPRNMPPELQAKKRDNAQTLPLANLARSTPNSQVIDRGDVVMVTISAGLNEKEASKIPVRVNDDGMGSVPGLGTISLAGLELQVAESVIANACIDGQLYRNPNVTVTMERQRMNRVTVIGAVKKPDVYELPRGKSDLLTAINAAGGLDKDAGTHIEIRNPRRSKKSRSPAVAGSTSEINPVGHSSGETEDKRLAGFGQTDSGGAMETVQVDLVSATKSKSEDYLIEDGGTVEIERRDPEPLFVMGHVKAPGKYEFPISEEVRVTDAIAIAGGMSITVADKIYVIRHVPNSAETAVIQVSLRDAKRNAQANIRLEPGDVVSVESTPATAIYEIVNIFRFNAGMSIPAAGIF